ncbi:SPOR domain-containing protein [Pseudomonas sp. SED1]|jgi:hypothetical protein|uniref:SPOR domain-containing protein n=1 Tax=Pseudomonas sp. SED1 TaxID=3056845 RepID=UPI00296F2C0B|nr:zinc ribbon domain-containing protein [Pseudomonas sp. SED1]MDY0831418.1 zinc ribbon domain-containing protein [Pseudomonas sp. SED1]
MSIYLSLWLALTVVTAYLASQRGRSGPRWFAIGLFVPVIPLIALLLMPRVPKTGVDALVHEDLRPCPACESPIKATAAQCKHCGAEVEPIALKYRSGWVVRLTADTDIAFGELVAQLQALDVPTVLDEPPHAFVGPFEEKAQAQNVLRYLKSDQGLDGLVTWRSVTR